MGLLQVIYKALSDTLHRIVCRLHNQRPEVVTASVTAQSCLRQTGGALAEERFNFIDEWLRRIDIPICWEVENSALGMVPLHFVYTTTLLPFGSILESIGQRESAALSPARC